MKARRQAIGGGKALLSALLALPLVVGLVSTPQATGAESIVYVLRHAERADAAQPQPDPHLSAAGHRRAARLADLLAAEPITAVLSSDYHRTRETSQPLAARLELPVEITTHERCPSSQPL